MVVFNKRKSLDACFFILEYFSIFIIFMVILISAKYVFPFDVKITWDKNEEKGIAGYKIFCRKEGQDYNYDYNAPVWLGTATSCAIYGLDDMEAYYLVARAFNASGVESENSDELRVELIDGVLRVNISNNSYNFIGNGCFITAGDKGL